MSDFVSYCRNCGRVYRYRKTNKQFRYVCENGESVNPKGICDRYCKSGITLNELIKKIDESLERMKDYQEGTYQIVKRPPLMTNYRVKE